MKTPVLQYIGYLVYIALYNAGQKRDLRLTWGVPQAELYSLLVNLKTCCVILKHSGHVILGERKLQILSNMSILRDSNVDG